MSLVNIKEADFEKTVQGEGIVLVDWWAPWCGPCRAFSPVYEKTSEKFPEVTFGKVNTEDEPKLAGAFNIQAIPTLMAFRDGILVFSQPGMVPPDALEELVTKVQQLDMDEVRREVEKVKSERPAAQAQA